MKEPSQEWEQRDLELWGLIDDLPEEEFLARMDALTAELPENDPVAFFERGAAQDSTGHADLAVPLYKKAIEGGVPGERKRRAVIQMASSLRNMGHPEESVELLQRERETGGHDHLSEALSAMLAFSLADAGREREAVAEAVLAVIPHMPRYHRSFTYYAHDLVNPEEEGEDAE